MNRRGTMEAFTNEFDLARNFGFDITMPDINMGLPGAAHRDYMDKCKGLYKEFISKMNMHIKQEKEIKKILSAIHREKIQNLRYSLYRTKNESNESDPFARRPLSIVSQTGLSTRTNTPWGLDIIHDEDEGSHMRPHTAPSFGQKSMDKNTASARPKTAGDALKRDSDNEADTDVTATTTETILGIVDLKTEGTPSQKITVGQHSFTKLEHGQVRARLKNKDGKFIIKPIKMEYRPDDDVAVHAFDPSKNKQTYDPLNEKIALVRKMTNFRSPTISSDMKINNRVPIQKTLKGFDAKRTTVLEIYRNARDRKSRHFRIVSAKARLGTSGDGNIELLNSSEATSPLNKRQKTLSDFRTKIGAFAHFASSVRQTVDVVSPSPTADDHHLSVSQSGNRLKSILHIPTMNDYMDSGRESQLEFHRPSSKVAFTENDSYATDQHRNPLFTHDIGRSKSESFTSNVNQNRSTSSTMNHKYRQRTVTETSDHDDNVFSGAPVRRNSDASLASVVSPVMRQKASMRSGTDHAGEQDLDVTKPSAAGGRRLSIASVVSASSFINKLKTATQKTKDSYNSEKSFALASKMDSRVDTVKIVKQQMKNDQHLDERMAVWRRRMSLKGSNSTSPVKRRNSGKMRLI